MRRGLFSGDQLVINHEHDLPLISSDTCFAWGGTSFVPQRLPKAQVVAILEHIGSPSYAIHILISFLIRDHYRRWLGTQFVVAVNRFDVDAIIVRLLLERRSIL